MEVTSQLHDLNSIAGSKTTTDTIQITKAIRTIAELLAPFVRCVLAGKHGRILQIIPRLQKVVKDSHNEGAAPACSPYSDPLRIDSFRFRKVNLL